MYKRLMFHKFKKEHQIQHFPYNHWGEKGLYSGRGIQIYFSQSCFRFYKKKSFETRVGVKNYDSAHTWHYSFDSWVGVNLHAKRKWFIVALSHVTSIVGKCALFYVLKRWLIAKTLMVFFCLASACEWVSEISSKLFPNRRFFVFKRPSHLTLYKITTRNKQRIYSKWISLSILLKSQLVTNKEYILNGYLYRFFWNHKKQDIFRKVPFRSKVSIKTWQLFLLSFDSRVGAKNCFQETLASGASWNNYLPQTKNVS